MRHEPAPIPVPDTEFRIASAEFKGEFTNAQRAVAGGMQRQNVSRSLKKLLDLCLVGLQIDVDGREVYVVADEMRLLGGDDE